jgi:hypothetical protein
MLARLTICAILAATSLPTLAHAENAGEETTVAEETTVGEPMMIPESLIPTVPEDDSAE